MGKIPGSQISIAIGTSAGERDSALVPGCPFTAVLGTRNRHHAPTPTMTRSNVGHGPRPIQVCAIFLRSLSG